MIAPLQRTLIKAAVATVLFIPAMAAAVIGYRTQRRMEERLRGEAAMSKSGQPDFPSNALPAERGAAGNPDRPDAPVTCLEQEGKEEA